MPQSSADLLFRVRMVGELTVGATTHEVNAKLTASVIGARATWMCNGQELMSSTDPEMVALVRWLLWHYAALPIASDPTIQNIFERLVAIAN